MKYSKTLLIILYLSFNSISAQETKLKIESLLGEWTISKTKSLNASKTEESELLCNVCPVISFKKDKTIVVKNPGGSEEIYSFDIVNKKLLIKNLGEKKSYSTFKNDDSFSAKYTQAKEYVELELTDSNDNSIVMRR